MRMRPGGSSWRSIRRSTSLRRCCNASSRRSSRGAVRTASEIAALTGGRLVGPGAVTVAGIAPLERAGPGDLSFLASSRYLPYFQRTSASVVLVAPALESSAGGAGGAGGRPETRVIVDEPYAALL